MAGFDFCIFARKKAAKNAKTIPDENSKELFENGEWARNGSCCAWLSLCTDCAIFCLDCCSNEDGD